MVSTGRNETRERGWAASRIYPAGLLLPVIRAAALDRLEPRIRREGIMTLPERQIPGIHVPSRYASTRTARWSASILLIRHDGSLPGIEIMTWLNTGVAASFVKRTKFT